MSSAEERNEYQIVRLKIGWKVVLQLDRSKSSTGLHRSVQLYMVFLFPNPILFILFSIARRIPRTSTPIQEASLLGTYSGSLLVRHLRCESGSK